MSDENCCGACGYPIHATKDRACDWCRQSADRIEALTEQLNAARADAKEAEAYAEEVEAMNKNQEAMIRQADRRGDALEAKLARAEWLLTDAAVQLEDGKIKTRRNRADLIWQFLEEIKGT
jgi:hypothetical protein